MKFSNEDMYDLIVEFEMNTLKVFTHLYRITTTCVTIAFQRIRRLLVGHFMVTTSSRYVGSSFLLKAWHKFCETGKLLFHCHLAFRKEPIEFLKYALDKQFVYHGKQVLHNFNIWRLSLIKEHLWRFIPSYLSNLPSTRHVYIRNFQWIQISVVLNTPEFFHKNIKILTRLALTLFLFYFFWNPNLISL